MAKKAANKPGARPQEPIWALLRTKRTTVLQKGLREMAGILQIAPTHLSDIETGKRTPSEGVLRKISEHYDIPEIQLRIGWSRPSEQVGVIAAQDATTIEKVPELLAAARTLQPAQWDAVIAEARRQAGLPPQGGR
jgi:transcriptional regulator with XRE-family HTH domain